MIVDEDFSNENNFFLIFNILRLLCFVYYLKEIVKCWFLMYFVE